jgi:hypothetical protein
MPSLNLRLCCVIEGEGLVFPVDIPTQDDVVDLKKKIQSERAKDTLQDVDHHTLELWKVPIMDEYVMCVAHLSIYLAHRHYRYQRQTNRNSP